MAETGLEIQLLEQISSSLRELVRLTRATSHPAIKDLLQATLDTEDKVLVYHLLDGTRGMKRIQDLTGVNQRYVSEWSREWERLGIAETNEASGIRGRRQKSFELSMFGIPIPDFPDDEAGSSQM